MRAAAEGSLAQLEEEYNQLEDTERQKRAAGILKVQYYPIAESNIRNTSNPVGKSPTQTSN